MSHVNRIVLIASTLVASWLGMQAVHESGHVLGAWLTGGRVARLMLHPLTISSTDVAANPRPLLVAWAGPMFGVLLPITFWGFAKLIRMPGDFVLRFFAGFCLLANGLYIGVGSFDHIGDCGEMLRHGSSAWQLWLFGIVTAPVGLWMWHGLGSHFGLGPAKRVSGLVAYGALATCLALLFLGFIVGGD